MSQRLESYLLKGTIVPLCCCSIYLRHLFATVAVFVSAATEGTGFSPYRTGLCIFSHVFFLIFLLVILPIVHTQVEMGLPRLAP